MGNLQQDPVVLSMWTDEQLDAEIARLTGQLRRNSGFSGKDVHFRRMDSDRLIAVKQERDRRQTSSGFRRDRETVNALKPVGRAKRGA